MNSYRMEELALFTGGALHKQVPEDVISELLIDSRRIYRPALSLFIALKTNRNDGHRYISTLVRQGVKNFLVSELPQKELLEKANFLKVPDTLRAMQKIAAIHRKRFNMPVLAITGSNGKTIVKEWIYELMRSDKRIVRSPKSYNSQVGVPLSVWLISEEHELAIIEAGISMPDEMQYLNEVIKPDLALITNLGSAHLENFNSRKAILEEKAKLFEGADKVYYCRDHLMIHEFLIHAGMPTVSWGQNEGSDFRIRSKLQKGKFTHVIILHDDQLIELNIPFTDEASVENALHAAVFALDQKVTADRITAGIARLHPVEMRLELRRGRQGSTIINDSYSADQESLRIAIDYMVQQVQHKKKSVILSDFLETGEVDDVLYRKLAELLNSKGINRLIGVGKKVPICEKYFHGECLFFNTTEELLQYLPSLNFSDECILLKGARIFGFEQVFSALQEKFHETVLEINLSAMVLNLNYYRSLVPHHVKIMAMVKAFSYGSGSAEVANVLQANGIDYLAVAYGDEGIELRKAGITVPIMVMNPEPGSLNEIVAQRLEPEIYSFRMLNHLRDIVLETSGYDGYPVKIHIKIDTGMNRLGFTENEIQKLAELLAESEFLEVASVFSHLAASEDPKHDEFTRLQIERFRRWTDQIQAHTGKSFLRHILNSAGISRHPDASFDMIRLGIGLYGVGNSSEQEKLTHVSSLKTTISQIKELQAGETVGYGRMGKIDSPRRIATLAIGYADGFPRKLGSGKGFVYIHGQKTPTIGNICMDMCMVDITAIPNAQEGDQATIFDSPDQLRDLSKSLETIPYEVLTGISARVKRIYFQE